MATLKDIAKECGLSLPTVAKILGKERELFTEKTQQKVLEAAARLGYRRSTIAANLVSGKTNAIYLITGAGDLLASSGKSDAYLGISEAAGALGQQISFLSVGAQSPFESTAFQRILMENICDGVILDLALPEELTDQLEEAFAKLHLPWIWLNAMRKENAVFPDEEAAAGLIAAKLIAAGQHNLFYVGTARTTHFSAFERPRALQEAFLRMGGAHFSCLNHWGTPDKFSEEMKRFFQNWRNDCALVFDSSALLLRAAKCAEECGRSLLREFPIAAFDSDTNYSEVSVRVKITCAAPDFWRMGYRAVESIAERIAAPDTAIPSVRIAPIFYPGETLF
ncbi:MAG: LacI family DNA-binding transcriptional regulator [Victivallaceae bacterium]|nr:LacI family DNA-binding transcriptional regulator [Victivallaceae bacterium]